MVIARGAIPLVVLGVGREVSGKTTRGQKVGLVLDLFVVGGLSLHSAVYSHSV